MGKDKPASRSTETDTDPRNKAVHYVDRGDKVYPSHYIPKRYVMTVLASNCILWAFALRFNLSVTIVAMVTAASINDTRAFECPAAGNITLSENQKGDFQWGSELQGIVLGSAYYGYLVTQIVGGRLAERFGGRRVMGYAMVAMSLVGLLTEAGARVSVYLLIVIRVLQGLAAGLVMPAVPVIMAQWSPVPERARINAFMLSGSTVGIVICHLVAGAMSSQSEFLGGWPSVFYTMGLCGLLSAVLWLLFVTDRPSQHSTISREEREYITTNLQSKQEGKSLPWRGVLTSRTTCAIYVAFFSSSWGTCTLGIMLPTYIKQVSNINLTENGVFSAMPYIIMWLTTNAGGIFSDVVLHKCQLKTVTVRKLVTGLGGLSSAAFTIAAGYTGCDAKISIAFVTMALGMSGLIYAGLYINPLDVAPQYAGTVMGIAYTFGTIPGFLSPYIAGYIIGDEPTLEKWRTVYVISAGIGVLGTLFFLLFASGEVQSWALERTDTPLSLSGQHNIDCIPVEPGDGQDD